MKFLRASLEYSASASSLELLGIVVCSITCTCGREREEVGVADKPSQFERSESEACEAASESSERSSSSSSSPSLRAEVGKRVAGIGS